MRFACGFTGFRHEMHWLGAIAALKLPVRFVKLAAGGSPLPAFPP